MHVLLRCSMTGRLLGKFTLSLIWSPMDMTVSQSCQWPFHTSIMSTGHRWGREYSQVRTLVEAEGTMNDCAASQRTSKPCLVTTFIDGNVWAHSGHKEITIGNLVFKLDPTLVSPNYITCWVQLKKSGTDESRFWTHSFVLNHTILSDNHVAPPHYGICSAAFSFSTCLAMRQWKINHIHGRNVTSTSNLSQPVIASSSFSDNLELWLLQPIEPVLATSFGFFLVGHPQRTSCLLHRPVL